MAGKPLQRTEVQFYSKVVVIAHGERIRKGLAPRFGFRHVPIIWASMLDDVMNLL